MKTRSRQTSLQHMALKMFGKTIRFNGKALRGKEIEYGVRIMTLCLVGLCANVAFISYSLCGKPDLHSVVVHAGAEVTQPVSVQQEELQNAVVLISNEVAKVYEVTLAMEVEEEIEEEQLYTIGSVAYVNNHGELIETSPVEFNLSSFELTTEYYPEWDYKERMDTINLLWDFLVNQQGMSPMNASAVIANICFEGKFGQAQGTDKTITDMQMAENVLGRGTKGYGLAQWTHGVRQDALLDYYVLANEQFPDDWEMTIKVAECCMLYEELKAYSIFSDIHVDTTLEDACGRVCLRYEAYENSSDQWKKVNGRYTLISNQGSGCKRLEYAENIYAYFMNGE